MDCAVSWEPGIEQSEIRIEKLMIEFAQPAALWTGLAIGLPILAHMAYQTVTQKHAFSSLRFIRPSSIPRTGRKSPSDWLLLLLRILLFSLLTLLLADPYWKDDRITAEGGTGRHAMIAIDLSPSMEGWNGLNEAKEKAKKLLEEDDYKYGLIGFGGKDLEVYPVGTKREELEDAIENLQHAWLRGNAQVLIDGVAKSFAEGVDEKRLVILSDFQSGDWQSVYRDLARDGIDFELMKVGANESNGGRSKNQGIVEARAVPIGSDKIRIWVVVRNWADEKVTTELSMIAGGVEKEKQALELNPLGSSQAQFILPAGDFSKATIRLQAGDRYPLDDQRSLWLKSPPPRRFGFWVGNDNQKDTSEEKDYLRTAVLSSGDSGWNRWELNQDFADALRMGDESVNLELLFGLGLGDWFEAEGLPAFMQSFLDRGGVALITPSEPFSASISMIKQSGLLDFSFSKVVGGASRSGEVFRIAALAEESPLSKIFSGKASRDLYLTSFFRFGVLKSVGDPLKIPIKDRNGRPLALVRDYESGGKLVFLPFRVNPRWTDLPLRNSFLPMLMELVQKGVSSGNTRTWPVLEPGDTWSGNEVFVAEKPGTYRFEDQWIEVVPSIAESSPQTYGPQELVDALGGRPKLSKNINSTDNLKDKTDRSLWLWFAIGVSILLIIEMIWSRPRVTQTNTGGMQDA